MTTQDILKSLHTPAAVAAFARMADAQREGVIELDPHDVGIVAAVHATRIAVAEQWSRGGRSQAELRAAEDCDRAFAPHFEALCVLDSFEDDAVWLATLRTNGVDVPKGSWWSYPLRLEDAMPTEAVLSALVLLTLQPPGPRREIAAWDAIADVPDWCTMTPHHFDESWLELRCYCGAKTEPSWHQPMPNTCGDCCGCTSGDCYRCGAHDESLPA